jgi:hypothetical protein
MEKDSKEEILTDIKSVVQRRDYALRPHAVSHMLSEGFVESDNCGGHSIWEDSRVV